MRFLDLVGLNKVLNWIRLKLNEKEDKVKSVTTISETSDDGIYVISDADDSIVVGGSNDSWEIFRERVLAIVDSFFIQEVSTIDETTDKGIYIISDD